MTTAAPLEDAPARTPFIRLSLMMLFQYAVWGIWLPILSNYLGTPVDQSGLGFTGNQKGWILTLAASLGALSSPFIAGQLADRVMNAERALGLMLILGGIVQTLLTWQTSFPVWLVGLTIYSILYMPTLALTNSVAFANLRDREKHFPPVRTFGTIGWIIGSVGFSLVFLQTAVRPIGSWPFLQGVEVANAGAQMKYAMLVAGLVAIGYGIFAFIALPATPPKRDSKRSLAFAAAFKLLTRPWNLALLVAALLVSMIHQVYFIRMGDYIESIWHSKSPIAPTMAIGQVSEIFFLAVLGLFIKRIGYKWIIILGALSFALRYGIFASVQTTTSVQLAMLLHGMCYGFFFAGAFLYVEKISPSDIRHSAQTVFGIIILGLGPVLAGVYNDGLDKLLTSARPLTDIASATTAPGPIFDYAKFWAIQAAIAFVAAVIMVVGFPTRVPDVAADVDAAASR